MYHFRSKSLGVQTILIIYHIQGQIFDTVCSVEYAVYLEFWPFCSKLSCNIIY